MPQTYLKCLSKNQLDTVTYNIYACVLIVFIVFDGLVVIATGLHSFCKMEHSTFSKQIFNVRGGDMLSPLG